LALPELDEPQAANASAAASTANAVTDLRNLRLLMISPPAVVLDIKLKPSLLWRR
jgi:hypothetical protein